CVYLSLCVCVYLSVCVCPYCNRTWDGWLCWGDSAPGTAVQLCPAYFQDFDPTGELMTAVTHSDAASV
uniref:G-protein coupled receptors family 2 profile 1 domain-containing protein n=1 Tax=Sinocyclocheilus grahami TaxID=75366 RepID=A0A672MSM3_SINGR